MDNPILVKLQAAEKTLAGLKVILLGGVYQASTSRMASGGQVLSRGIELGAVGTAKVMSLGTKSIKSALPRNEVNREIPRIVVTGSAYAKHVTEHVLEISSSILGALNKMTANLASLTACYVKNSSGGLMSKAIETSGISQATVDEITSEIQDVGEGMLGATFAAYAGMESAAHILASALHENTVEIVTHCYGLHAADALNSAGEVVGNVVLAGRNAGQLMSPRDIVINSTKEAGRCLALDKCNPNPNPSAQT